MVHRWSSYVWQIGDIFWRYLRQWLTLLRLEIQQWQEYIWNERFIRFTWSALFRDRPVIIDISYKTVTYRITGLFDYEVSFEYHLIWDMIKDELLDMFFRSGFPFWQIRYVWRMLLVRLAEGSCRRSTIRSDRLFLSYSICTLFQNLSPAALHSGILLLERMYERWTCIMAERQL